MAGDVVIDFFNWLREVTTGSEAVGNVSLSDAQIQLLMDGKVASWGNVVTNQALLPSDATPRQGGRDFANLVDLYAYLRKGGLVGGDVANPTPLSFVWIHQKVSQYGTIFYDVYFTEDS